MSGLRAAAALIRSAVRDEACEADLLALAADPAIAATLVDGPVEVEDLPWLSPREWQWYIRWRQARGGRLDRVLLDHLERATRTSRVDRFELRVLVMRDPGVQHEAAEQSGAAAITDPGLAWLGEHCQRFPDSLEVARDALQVATEAAWFSLRVLTERSDSADVRAFLEFFARERDLPDTITHRWSAVAAAATEPDAEQAVTHDLRFALGRVRSRQIQAAIARVLEGLAEGTILPRRDLTSRERRMLGGLRVGVQETAAGSSLASVDVVVSLSGFGDADIVGTLWDEIIEPELRRSEGADALGRRRSERE